jgi:hypothetical protein
VRDLTLRVLASAIGYVGLVLMLRSPEPVREFALYLPSSILFTLAVDRGRSELALRDGASHECRRRILRESLAIATLGLLLLAFAPVVPMLMRARVLLALCISGALQAYVDLVLRHWLFVFRRAAYVYVCQLATACANVAIAAAASFRVIPAEFGVLLFLGVPVLVVTLQTRVLRPGGLDRGNVHLGESIGDAKETLAAMLFRVFPPAAYTGYTAALSRCAPEFAPVARAFYFIFGFIHLRTMARESSVRSAGRTAAILLALTIVTAVPLTLFGSGRLRLDAGGLAMSLLLTTTVCVAFSFFLVRYTRFVANKCPEV